MGYTHYFSLKSRHKRTGVKKLQSKIQKVLDEHKDIIQLDYDEKGVPLNEVKDNEIFVRFNGIDDDGHETFYFDSTSNGDFYCKTNEKPYDLVICKVLALLKAFYGNAFELKSDGFYGYQPKDKFFYVGSVPNNALDGNWNLVWDWFNNLLPFNKYMSFIVVGVHGTRDINGRLPYFKAEIKFK